MKRIFLFAIVTLSFVLNSCNTRFLDDQLQLVEMSTEPIVIDLPSVNRLDILTIQKLDQLTYTVLEYPKFMKLKSTSGVFTNGQTQFEYTTSDAIDYLRQAGLITGTLVLNVVDYGLVAYPVQIGNIENGWGSFAVSTNNLDFGDQLDFKLTIYNNGSESMGWKLAEMPSWLSADLTEGEMNPYSMTYINFHVNRAGMSANHYSGNVLFQLTNCQVNDYLIQASMYFNEGEESGNNIKQLTGFVLDAGYLKGTDKLLVLTQTPNQLISIDTKTNQQTVLDLSFKPNSLTISEDEQSAIVLYKVAMLETIDLKNMTIQKQYELPTICYRTEIGENGWCYLSTMDHNMYKNLYCLNLETEEIVGQYIYNLREKTNLYKVPGYKRLIAVPSEISPSGIYWGSFENDTINGFSNETDRYDTGGYLWMVKDGSLMLCRSKGMYKYNADNNSINKFGEFDGGFSSIHWADECTETNKVALSVSYGYQSPAGDSWVSVWDLNSYSEVKKYYPVNVNNTTHYIYFAFFNNEGSQLYLLTRNDMNPYTTDGNWFLDIKNVSN